MLSLDIVAGTFSRIWMDVMSYLTWTDLCFIYVGVRVCEVVWISDLLGSGQAEFGQNSRHGIHVRVGFSYVACLAQCFEVPLVKI